MRYCFTLCLLLVVSAPVQDLSKPLGIIDMHMHALSANHFGGVGLKVCPGNVQETFPAADPRAKITTDDLEDCPNPLYSPKTDEEVLRRTKLYIERYNIKGVASGHFETVQKWRSLLGDKIIPAILFYHPGEVEVSRLREWIQAGEVAVIGELGSEYRGLAPNDPSLEPYFALAEELDVPVAVHMGLGAPGGPRYYGQKDYRARLTNPLALEEVLNRHPGLRIYVMHAGWPMEAEMIHMLYTYPQLYVDFGVIDWFLPRKEFHRYLQRLVQAGFGERIMFGSDQMIWPQAIEVGIEAIRSAEFLNEKQKRDILYNNAARFLRLNAH